VFLRLEMEFGACSCVGRGEGVSIYMLGSKTSHLVDFAVKNRLNRPYGWFNPLGQADS
jgi:phage gp45-like